MMSRIKYSPSVFAPGLIIFLVEQSGLYPDISCLQEAVNIVNDLINHIISENYDFHRTKAKNRWYIYVIQYNIDAKLVASGFLSDLEENPKSLENKEMNVGDGAGGSEKKEFNVPSWVSTVSGKDQANMRDAFLFAEELINQWTFERPDTPMPLIINVSSGIPFYEGKELSECRKEVIRIVSRINSAENVQVFNVKLGGKEKVVFPSLNIEIDDEDTRFMCELSTVVPENYLNWNDNNYMEWRNKEDGSVVIKEGDRLFCDINILDNLKLFIDYSYCPHTGQYNLD